jgi:excisionase family DNA binding protein
MDLDAMTYEVMTAKETAIWLRVSMNTLYDLVRRGKIPCRRVGRSCRFSRALLLEWVGSTNVRGDSKGRKLCP